jgi:hypothetical protein
MGKVLTPLALNGRALNITGEAEIQTLPNVKNVTVGFRSAKRLSMSNMTVILGGSSTTEMSLEHVSLSGLTGLERGSKLESLTVDSM